MNIFDRISLDRQSTVVQSKSGWTNTDLERISPSRLIGVGQVI